jgi:outer membrane protein insertion porin family
VEGNQRIEDAAITRVVGTKEGDVYDPDRLSGDLTAIYEMGYFDDVAVSVDRTEDGNVVIFTVKEKPTLREITFSGNKVYDDDSLMESIDISTGSILNIYRINRNVRAIEARYREKNYHNAVVSYEINELPNNQGDLEFKIDEGKKIRIEKIEIRGNREVDDKTLKKLMSTSERGFFSWITGSGELNPDVLEQDIMRLNAYYYSQGYAEARVADPEIVFEDESIRITIRIEEGTRFAMGSVDMQGDLIRSREELIEMIRIDQESYFNQEVLRDDILFLTDLYADQGFAMAEIYPETRKHPEKDEIDLIFNIRQNQPVYFDEINITGNTKTRDKVIRRELHVHEQGLYSASGLKRSVRNLYRLDFFEDIDVQTFPGDGPDQLNLAIEVQEKPTGTFSFGAGHSAIDNLYVMTSIEERNFLGRGQIVELRGQVGGRSQQYSFSFTEPWLFDIPLSAGISAYNWRRDYDEYDRDSKGGQVRLSYPVFDYTRAFASYGYDYSSVTDVSPAYEDRIEAGDFTTSSITTGLTYDTRDRIINPSEGSRHRVTYQFAGLGGNVGFNKIKLELGRYFPLLWDVVFFLNGEAGYVREGAGKLLPDYEKFYLGGINSMRGFTWRGISAFDDLGREVGGEKYVQFNAELIFPIVRQAGLMGVIFHDTGNVYTSSDRIELDDLRRSAGFGIRWFSPLGPIRLERGYILDRERGEDSGRWEFSIGGSF